MKRLASVRIATNGSCGKANTWPTLVALGLTLCAWWAGQARADVIAGRGVGQAAPRDPGLWAAVRDPAPEPRLGPDAVVGIVLNALQHNDDPVADHGIAVTFAFTSPENHDVTGPIGRFRALVKSSAYRPMLGHMRADRGPVTFVAAHARERVTITGAHGEHAVYMFLLSRQETGAFKGCWMADGVLRETDAMLDVQTRPLVTAVALRRD